MNTSADGSAKLLTGARLATMRAGGPAYGLIEDAALVIGADGRIAWCGTAADLPARFSGLPSRDLGGRLVTPGLIDCHTHIVHGGNRAREFEMRLEGASYEEIARAGGGIVSTVTATRAASEDDLRYALGLFETYGKDTGRRPEEGDNKIRPIELFMCSVIRKMGYADGFRWLAQFF